jgi:CRISPR-associated protein (TIGR02584 family)
MANPADPASYPRRDLLVLVGLSPQIVTETLYALAVLREPAFVPTHIELLTTTEGSRRALSALLDRQTGAYWSFCVDYGLRGGEGALCAENIRVMADGDGVPLDDIRTAADSGTAADAIVARIRALTENTDSALHVSIAGGRKTMGFLAGHALSLFGRAQDRLSHVLVDDRFTALPEFFYPPPRARNLLDRSGRWLSTTEAGITLAEIPFLRLREPLSAVLPAGGRSYTQTIARAQAALDPRLELDPAARIARFGGQTLHLPPAMFAWLLWMAERRRDAHAAHGGALHWTEADPEEILAQYARIGDPASVARMRRALAGEGLKAAFEQRTARVNKLVRDGLGPAALPYLLLSDRQRPRSRTGLTLPPDRIRIDP